MKRSRVFLGVTTALLAIAGVAAAKAHRGPRNAVYYYTKFLAGQGVFYCTKIVTTHCDANGALLTCTAPTTGKILYTRFANTCVVKAKYNPQ